MLEELMMHDVTAKIRIRSLYKVFGAQTQRALTLCREGVSKNDILEQTGTIVGLRNINLDIRSGEIFVVMGLSGSGKSTLLRHFNRLVEPSAGEIKVDGDDILAMNARQLIAFRRQKISMVFQKFGLLPHHTVFDNVMCGLRLQGMPHLQAQEQAREKISLVGLAGFEDKYPHQLSGGMQQRVGLARALATEAEILLMDEAFSALDPLIRSDMQDQLLRIQKQLRKTVVFITHDLDEALHIGDRIAILKDGLLRQVGDRAQILFNPADDYVKKFVGKVNLARTVNAGILCQNGSRGSRYGQEIAMTSEKIRTDENLECAEIDRNVPLLDLFSLFKTNDYLLVLDEGKEMGILSQKDVFDALDINSYQSTHIQPGNPISQ